MSPDVFCDDGHEAYRMSTFISVNDQLLCRRIVAAIHRIVFVAPAVSREVAVALGECFRRAGSVTIVLDRDEEAYRLGYGDREGLERLQKLARDNHIGIRSQPGLRIGLLLVDDDVLVWSPTPQAVEGQRSDAQPNGLDLRGTSARGTASMGDDAFDLAKSDGSPTPTASLSDVIRNAVGADDSDVPIGQAEIGCEAFTPEQVSETVEALKKDPPAPFDLARKTRVFSTRFQFVESELRGAAWTTREIKLSSLLLNPDIPDELQDLFETRVRPIVALIKARAERSQAKDKLKDIDIDGTVRSGIKRLRVIQPSIKLVFKEISWESTRDGEFTEALRKALTALLG
jgi:hypothetical protein